jgi:hypothetical protein
MERELRVEVETRDGPWPEVQSPSDKQLCLDYRQFPTKDLNSWDQSKILIVNLVGYQKRQKRLLRT